MLIVPEADPSENRLFRHAKPVDVSLTGKEPRDEPLLLNKQQLIDTICKFYGSNAPSFEVNRLRPKMDVITTMSIVICLIDWIKSTVAKRVDLSRFRLEAGDRKRIERLFEDVSRSFEQTLKNTSEYANAIRQLDPIVDHRQAFASLMGIIVGIIETDTKPVAAGDISAIVSA